MSSAGDPERRTSLLRVKLRALVTSHWPDAADAEPASVADGVALQAGGRAWVLVEEPDGGRGFGRALLWGLHQQCGELHVLIDHPASAEAAARQAACFRIPVTVWRVEGRELVRAEPMPLPPEPPLDPDLEPMIPLIEAAGAESVVEWGRLTAEVLGLQVAEAYTGEGGTWIEVGIGKHDRLAAALAWTDIPPEEALERIVEIASEARRSSAHRPLNQIGRERWLRHRLVHEPDRIGARRLEPVSPPVPLTDLRAPLLAPAVGEDADGRPILVACSVGFDPAFVPMAAELQTARFPKAELVLVLPRRDVHPLIRQAAEAVAGGATIRTVPDDWYANTLTEGLA
jgi:hypothetical protein